MKWQVLGSKDAVGRDLPDLWEIYTLDGSPVTTDACLDLENAEAIVAAHNEGK